VRVLGARRRRRVFGSWALAAVVAAGPATADFNIAAPDAAQRGLLFVIEAPESSRVGTDADPFTIRGGTQEVLVTFEGDGNALDGDLVASDLALEATLQGDLNTVTFSTTASGLVGSRIGLAVQGSLNGFELRQPEDSLELRELDLAIDVVGGSNTLRLSPADGAEFDWTVEGDGSSFAVESQDSLDVVDRLLWRGGNGRLERIATAIDGVVLETTVDGEGVSLRHVLRDVLDATLRGRVVGFDHEVRTEIIDSERITLSLDVSGAPNTVDLRVEDSDDFTVDLDVTGGENLVETFVRGQRAGRIGLRLDGRNGEARIEQQADLVTLEELDVETLVEGDRVALSVVLAAVLDARLRQRLLGDDNQVRLVARDASALDLSVTVVGDDNRVTSEILDSDRYRLDLDVRGSDNLIGTVADGQDDGVLALRLDGDGNRVDVVQRAP
jgi:hypothetical protein